MTIMSDPPRLDYAAGDKSRSTVWVKRLVLALAFYPLLLLLCVYGGWLIAWAHLGHRPDPVFDDPMLIDKTVNAAIVPAAMLTLLAWPMFIAYLALVGVVFYGSLTPGNP